MVKGILKGIIRNYWQSGWVGKLLYLVMAAGLLSVTAVFLLFLLVWLGFFGRLPDAEELARIRNPIASEVYSADSVLLGKYYLEERSPITADELPEHVKNALIATEDVRFYEHGGIDYRSLVRVAVKTILMQDESSGGGSTITQQLAKNLYRRKAYAMLSLPINKIREFIIAKRLEQVYEKNDILVLYLNTIPFADNTYGIRTAANRFFSKSVKDLTVAEAAVLIGMLKATHSYNPRLFPERSLARRNVVVRQMEKYGFLDIRESDRIQKQPIKLQYNNTDYNAGSAPYFRAFLRQELLEWCKEHRNERGEPYNLYTDGLKIYTTIDSRMQSYAEKAMRQQMAIIQRKFDEQLNRKTLDEVVRSKIRGLSQYQSLAAEGLSEESIMKKLNTPGPTNVFSWSGDQQLEVSIIDSLRHHVRFLQTGIKAVDPSDGAVKVWVGGIDHRFFKYDHVRTSTRRQVGSTIKPLVYAAAIESGIGPCEYISARKTEYTNMEGWTPENTNDETYDKKYSMEGGLAGSVNTVSVKLLEMTGINATIETLRKLGISSDLPAVPSLALGTPSISMTEMVAAYAALANGGRYNEPYYLTSITDRDGNVLQRFQRDDNSKRDNRALSEETSKMIVHMLKTVVSEGTGSALRSSYGITNDVAGKTGTTQSNVDGWFIAMTPRLVIGAWVGSDDPRLHFRTTALGQGAATALPIVARFFKLANDDKSLSDIMHAKFPALPEELRRKLDCRPSKSDRNIFERIFKKKKGTKVTEFKPDE